MLGYIQCSKNVSGWLETYRELDSSYESLEPYHENAAVEVPGPEVDPEGAEDDGLYHASDLLAQLETACPPVTVRDEIFSLVFGKRDMFILLYSSFDNSFLYM